MRMSSWVVDMEKKLRNAELPAKVERWPKHCIFRVPLRFKVVDGSVYKPKTVSLDPFHHGDEDLRPMEDHKLRAVGHLLRRDSCKTSLAELVAAVEEVAEELEDAYMDLEDEWRGEENRGKFLQMMITDGCFMLEVMRTALTLSLEKKNSIAKDCYVHDPVFSWHGIRHIKPFVERDMLMVENQLPLRLLEKIVAVESGTPPSVASINSMVLKFLGLIGAQEGIDLGLHPLDIYRTSLLKGPQKHLDSHTSAERLPPWMTFGLVHPSVSELTMAGVRFVPSISTYLDDIDLKNRRLNMPRVQLDDSTAYKFHNMMAFEAMHVGTGNDVTSYILFVDDLINSAHDVRLLVRTGILEHHGHADQDAVVRLFNGLTRNVAYSWESSLWRVREDVVRHCRRRTTLLGYLVRPFLHGSWDYLATKYLRNPWTLLALVTATLLLVADLVQAVYAVKSYKDGK